MRGLQPTIVEKAPSLRTGGYIIDFRGAGFDVAARMGLLPDLRAKGYVVQEVRVVNRNGNRIAGFPAQVFDRITGCRYLSIPRGDLAATIFGAIQTVAALNVEHYIPRDESVYLIYTQVGQQVGRFAMRNDRTKNERWLCVSPVSLHPNRAPASSSGNSVMNLLQLPGLARLAFRTEFTDKISLPEY